MEDFFVQECCVHGTDLENHGPTSILCDDPFPIESNVGALKHNKLTFYFCSHFIIVLCAIQRSGDQVCSSKKSNKDDNNK